MTGLPGLRSRGGWFVGPIFFALAWWMIEGQEVTAIPIEKTPGIPEGVLSTAPRRAILQHPPMLRIGGPYERTCMDCHRLPFATNDMPGRVLLQHANIQVQHGADKRCLDCHSEKNRDLLVLRTGEEITFDEVPRLCGQCHAPTYFDWLGGMHGRTNGYWNAELGPVNRLKCSHCHDPHAPRHPALDPLVPLPGPHTLRMGERHPSHAGEELESRDPLHRALRIERRPEEHGEEPHTEGGDEAQPDTEGTQVEAEGTEHDEVTPPQPGESETNETKKESDR